MILAMQSIYRLVRTLGGAIIINSQIYMGKEGHSGTVEHMTIIPDGPTCYCGKKDAWKRLALFMHF